MTVDNIITNLVLCDYYLTYDQREILVHLCKYANFTRVTTHIWNIIKYYDNCYSKKS